MPISIALLARTHWGLEAARRLHAMGHQIKFVATHKPEPFYECGIDEYRSFANIVGAYFVDGSQVSSANLVSQVPSECAIAVSVNWPSILGSDFIEKFPFGIVNVHAGDLPRYRGNACPNWAILNGETKIGLCAHLMEPGSLDSGPVLLREYFLLTSETYIGDVYRWFDEVIPEILTRAVVGLVGGTVKPIAQPTDPALSLRCYPRRPEDGRIDWRRSAVAIHRLVRASSRPFAGAFAFLEDGRRVTIWRASPWSHPGPFCAVPGQVMVRMERGPVIACGEGCLLIEEAEVDGLGTAQSIIELARSLRARLS